MHLNGIYPISNIRYPIVNRTVDSLAQMFNPSCFTCFIWISSFQKKTKDTNCYHDDKNSSAWLPALCGTCFQNKTLQYINFNIAEEVGKSIELWICFGLICCKENPKPLFYYSVAICFVVTLLSSLKYCHMQCFFIFELIANYLNLFT